MTDQELLRTLVGGQAEILSNIPINKLSDKTRQELKISRAAFERLMAGIELGKRVKDEEQAYEIPTALKSPKDAIEFCRAHFRRLIEEAVQEHFYTLMLNTKLKIIDLHLITVGTVNASLGHPREVFRPAIRNAASSIIVAHNHPSGDPTPSKEDLIVTEKLKAAGEVVGIELKDHIAMGRHGVVSIAEMFRQYR